MSSNRTLRRTHRGHFPFGHDASSPWRNLEPLEARLLLSASAVSGADWPQSSVAVELFQTSTAIFIENQGQWADDSLRFLHRGSGADVAMTDAGPVFHLFERDPAEPNDAGGSDTSALDDLQPFDALDIEPFNTQSLSFSASFVGANPSTPMGLDLSNSRFHFQLGDDPSRWRSDVPGYEVVAYEELYEGIDLHTWGRRDNLKYEFVVAPGAAWTACRTAGSHR